MSHRVAIVGATGLVGQELLRLLTERDFPVRSLSAFASARGLGRTVVSGAEEIPVQTVDPDRVAAHDVVFLSAGAAVSRQLEPVLRASSAFVFDNSSAFRMDSKTPLCVPEVNPESLRAGRYVAVPNCTAILLVLLLSPLHRRFGLRRVIVSTYQAVSGAGRGALARMRADTRAALDLGSPAGGLAFNLIPAIGAESAVAGTTGEEAKVVQETRRILSAPRLPIHATCVRVPVERAHSESVWLELDGEPELQDVREALESAPGVTLRDDLQRNLYPQPSVAAGGDGILVGRVRGAGEPGTFSMFLSGDQLRKGAALNAIQLAEVQLGILDP